METQTLITKINGVEISAVRDEEHNFFVPVKPICEAIGVDPEAQRQRIMRHYILGSTAFTLKVVAADDKEREMLCLPVEFVYGWLFTIDASLVAEASRDNVKRYQLECYQALYTHFAGAARRQQEQNRAEQELLNRKAAALDSISSHKKAIAEDNAEIKKVDEQLSRLQAERLNPQPSLFD